MESKIQHVRNAEYKHVSSTTSICCSLNPNWSDNPKIAITIKTKGTYENYLKTNKTRQKQLIKKQIK